MNKSEVHLRINQHDMVELRQKIAQLRLVGLKELTPDGDVKKEVGDLDIRAHGT